MPGLEDRMVGGKNIVQALEEPLGAYSVSKTNNHSNKYMVTNRRAMKEKHRVP